MEVDAQPPAENRSAFKMIGLMRGVQWRSGTIGTERLKDLPLGCGFDPPKVGSFSLR